MSGFFDAAAQPEGTVVASVGEPPQMPEYVVQVRLVGRYWDAHLFVGEMPDRAAATAAADRTVDALCEMTGLDAAAFVVLPPQTLEEFRAGSVSDE